MTDKVKVRIQCSGTWSYYGVVEMPRTEFDRLDKDLDDGGLNAKRALEEITSGLVDQRDIDFNDDDELDEFEIVKDKKP